MRLERYDLSNGVTSEGGQIKLNLRYSPLRGGFGGLCNEERGRCSCLVRGVAVGAPNRHTGPRGFNFTGPRGNYISTAAPYSAAQYSAL